jgi:mono/diheme cytochrome c family protein
MRMTRTNIVLLILSLVAAILSLLADISAVYSADPPMPAATQPTVKKPIDEVDAEFFEKHIRPVLVEHCYSCHSSKAIKVRGELLLDSPQGVAKGGAGGTIIAAEEPEKSRLLEAIRWNDPDFQMPPKKKLSDQQIEKFEQWVKRGAPYPQVDPATPAHAAKESNDSVKARWWSLQPVKRPDVSAGVTKSTNPIDAFIAAEYAAKKLMPAQPADKAVLLRRVYLDLIGIPPTPAQQVSFLADASPDAYDKVVEELLASEQHGVRYARHWLDVLRYADADERMIAAPGIYLWRDWVINALNDDIPYDQFVRTQLTGYRTSERTQISATGHRSKAEMRPDDQFALGLLVRGAVVRDSKSEGELAISAVETISTAFMGFTVGCAKCHDHIYDPITQRDFYAMKALFDPLVPRKVPLVTAADLFASGRSARAADKRRVPIEAAIETLIAPHRKKLYDERVAMLPDDVRPIILKPMRQRSIAEQKVADDYFPILRIDGDKLNAVMPDDDRRKYQDLQRQLSEAGAGNGGRNGPLAAFWTIEVDGKKEGQKSYVLTSGDPERPELDHEVTPGWPFSPADIDFRDGRVETFSDWLTAPENPLLARVAVNRIWQWHFGEGLQKSVSDFGKLGGTPLHPRLLDWLASEFTAQKLSMKAMHRLIVTSDTYRLASKIDEPLGAANNQIDAANTYLWRFPLQRLDAESIWDSIFTASGSLDFAVGGPSFEIGSDGGRRRGGSRRQEDRSEAQTTRRAAYLIRGFSTSRDVLPTFLQAFDVDDGRVPCPQRTQTVTASQGLFMMNSDEVERATIKFAERLQQESKGDLSQAIGLGYRITLAREPTPLESSRALAYLNGDPANLKGFAWLLFNLDEFIYLR